MSGHSVRGLALTSALLISACVVFTDTSAIDAGARDSGEDTAEDTLGGDATAEVSDEVSSDVPSDVPDAAGDVSPDAQDPCASGPRCVGSNGLLLTCEGVPQATSCAFGCSDGACRPECVVPIGCSSDSSATVSCERGLPVVDDECPPDFACSDGGCRRTDECVPGSARCVADGILLCDQTGTLSVFVPCGEAECTAVWPDADGDSWGDGFQPAAYACGVPEGTADNDLDCDDTVASDPSTPCPGWAIVEPGTFLMGTPEGELSAVPPEERQQLVRVTRRLLVMQTEVTQEMWVKRSQASRNPSFHAECPTCPVESVNWFDALRFANELSRAEGLETCYTLGECPVLEYGTGCPEGEASCVDRYVCDRATFRGLDCEGYRLPAEFEWEYFTRAGQTGRFPAALDTVGWFRESIGEMQTRPVAMLEPNAFGLYDVHGNVFEWVMDLREPYGGDTESVSEDPLVFGTPREVTERSPRVIRGGAFNTPETACRAAARGVAKPDVRNLVTGFRLVRTFANDAQR